jgi:hypothetical protein
MVSSPLLCAAGSQFRLEVDRDTDVIVWSKKGDCDDLDTRRQAARLHSKTGHVDMPAQICRDGHVQNPNDGGCYYEA